MQEETIIKNRIRANEYYKKVRFIKSKIRFCWICKKDLRLMGNRRRFCLDCQIKQEAIRKKIKYELRNNRLCLLILLGGCCSNCRSKINLQIHHITRENKLKNLKILCNKCHLSNEYKQTSLSFPVYTGNLKKEIKGIMSCNYCKSKHFVIVHHKDRNRKNNHPDNLILLCRKCHTKEHNLMPLLDKNNSFKNGVFKKKYLKYNRQDYLKNKVRIYKASRKYYLKGQNIRNFFKSVDKLCSIKKYERRLIWKGI